MKLLYPSITKQGLKRSVVQKNQVFFGAIFNLTLSNSSFLVAPGVGCRFLCTQNFLHKISNDSTNPYLFPSAFSRKQNVEGDLILDYREERLALKGKS